MTSRPDIPVDLIVRAKAGDKAAFGVIVESTKSTLYAFIRRSIFDRDEAYDVLQNTFLSAWLGLKKFDTDKALLPWLRTIALNKCRDHGRQALVRRLFLRAKAVEPPEELQPNESNDDRLDRLDRAIVTLPSFYREPLILTAINGLTHAEAAEVLNTSPKAIEMRVRRARKQILEILGEVTEG